MTTAATDSLLGITPTVFYVAFVTTIVLACIKGIFWPDTNAPTDRTYTVYQEHKVLGWLIVMAIIAYVITGVVALYNDVTDHGAATGNLLRRAAAAVVIFVVFVSIRACIRWARS